MEILDGKFVAQTLLNQIADDISSIKQRGGRIPRLDMILVGDDYGSIKYVGMKEKTARDVGMQGKVHHLKQNVDTQDILNLVDDLNKDSDVDGFMIQLPLPQHINTQLILERILPRKDVDGLSPVNLGKLFQKDKKALSPATPLGIMKLLEYYNIKVFGKKVVILGSSNIIGTPLLAMMLEKNATATLCNAHTVGIQDISNDADILISATGVPLLVKGSFLKKGCVVVDVGANRHPETGQLVGDVDWDSVQGIPSYITPVPGGVGPMTIASLMLNLMTCYKYNNER